MSYQVIARKYRPQRFEDVVGQEHVTQTLTNAIQQKRIAHAYLFVGPRGTGKTTIARIFAKCLNCTGGPKVDFHDDDPRCQEISEGRSLDVLEIDGASNRGIEEIRALRETVKYAPATGRYKIYIIDEVHMLTKEAFNALLKTLEEPPEHVKFMFATTEPEKVIATILSRCQRYDLRRIPAALIIKHLTHIAGLEKVTVDEAALHAIARGSEGCMRDAESTLDQLISFCGAQIVEADVLSMFGLTARNQIYALAGALLDGNMESALRILNDLAKNGKDLSRLLSDLLGHFRNFLIYQVGRADLSLLEITEAEAATLKVHADTVSTDGVTRIMEVLADCESRLRDTASKKILIEVTLLKAIQARKAVSLDVVLRQLQQLRAGGVTGPASSPVAAAEPKPAFALTAAPSSARPSLPIQQPSSVAVTPLTAAPALDVAPTPVAPESPTGPGVGNDLESLWRQVLEAVGRVSQFTRSYLLQAHPVSFVNGVFTIGFDPEFSDHIELVDNPKNRALIQTKLRELGRGEVQIKIVKADAPAGRPAQAEAPPGNLALSSPEPVSEYKPVAAKPPGKSVPAASAPEAKTVKPVPKLLNKEDFKNDPLIKQALEIFKGQIVEVRS